MGSSPEAIKHFGNAAFQLIRGVENAFFTEPEERHPAERGSGFWDTFFRAMDTGRGDQFRAQTAGENAVVQAFNDNFSGMINEAQLFNSMPTQMGAEPQTDVMRAAVAPIQYSPDDQKQLETGGAGYYARTGGLVQQILNTPKPKNLTPLEWNGSKQMALENIELAMKLQNQALGTAQKRAALSNERLLKDWNKQRIETDKQNNMINRDNHFTNQFNPPTGSARQIAETMGGNIRKLEGVVNGTAPWANWDRQVANYYPELTPDERKAFAADMLGNWKDAQKGIGKALTLAENSQKTKNAATQIQILSSLHDMINPSSVTQSTEYSGMSQRSVKRAPGVDEATFRVMLGVAEKSLGGDASLFPTVRLVPGTPLWDTVSNRLPVLERQGDTYTAAETPPTKAVAEQQDHLLDRYFSLASLPMEVRKLIKEQAVSGGANKNVVWGFTADKKTIQDMDTNLAALYFASPEMLDHTAVVPIAPEESEEPAGQPVRTGGRTIPSSEEGGSWAEVLGEVPGRIGQFGSDAVKLAGKGVTREFGMPPGKKPSWYRWTGDYTKADRMEQELKELRVGDALNEAADNLNAMKEQSGDSGTLVSNIARGQFKEGEPETALTNDPSHHAKNVEQQVRARGPERNPDNLMAILKRGWTGTTEVADEFLGVSSAYAADPFDTIDNLWRMRGGTGRAPDDFRTRVEQATKQASATLERMGGAPDAANNEIQQFWENIGGTGPAHEDLNIHIFDSLQKDLVQPANLNAPEQQKLGPSGGTAALADLASQQKGLLGEQRGLVQDETDQQIAQANVLDRRMANREQQFEMQQLQADTRQEREMFMNAVSRIPPNLQQDLRRAMNDLQGGVLSAGDFGRMMVSILEGGGVPANQASILTEQVIRDWAGTRKMYASSGGAGSDPRSARAGRNMREVERMLRDNQRGVA